jgi:hypothetical protein
LSSSKAAETVISLRLLQPNFRHGCRQHSFRDASRITARRGVADAK